MNANATTSGLNNSPGATTQSGALSQGIGRSSTGSQGASNDNVEQFNSAKQQAGQERGMPSGSADLNPLASQSSSGAAQQSLGAQGGGASQAAGADGGAGAAEGEGGEKGEAKKEELMAKIQELLSAVLKLLKAMSGEGEGASAPSAGATALDDGTIQDAPGDGGGSGGGGPSGVGGGGAAGGPPGAGNIPRPQEHIQTLQLGNKTVKVGGDGTGAASAQEVAATAKSIEHMYNTSPTFKNMIDNSQHQNLEVSVGRRSDNTSWGGGGRVFMNINNVAPGNSDTFQGLLGHEFAHAAAGLHHGAELDRIEAATAAEA